MCTNIKLKSLERKEKIKNWWNVHRKSGEHQEKAEVMNRFSRIKTMSLPKFELGP